MGSLYLVRHGQASFGAADYDQLSDLGHRQSVRLGEYFKHQGIAFDATLTGTLNRQVQTYQGICSGMGVEPAAMRWPGLNEYDSHALIAAVHPGPLDQPATGDVYRDYFRQLKRGLAQWMAGTASPLGMPAYRDFVGGVTTALDLVRSRYVGNVLLVSSGGPIATAVAQVLECSPAATIELNLRIRNASVTEMAFTPKRHVLLTFNTLPHLDAPEYAGWMTYA